MMMTPVRFGGDNVKPKDIVRAQRNEPADNPFNNVKKTRGETKEQKQARKLINKQNKSLRKLAGKAGRKAATVPAAITVGAAPATTAVMQHLEQLPQWMQDPFVAALGGIGVAVVGTVTATRRYFNHKFDMLLNRDEYAAKAERMKTERETEKERKRAEKLAAKEARKAEKTEPADAPEDVVLDEVEESPDK